MRYLMLVCTDDSFDAARAAELEGEGASAMDWVQEMDRRGVRLIGERTRPASDATTVRIRDGRLLVTDGPYAETKEHIAGFDVLECRDLDEAIEVASKHPMARAGLLELRPFWP
ncbi:YciI family protein [Spirilliplanes yamanashiensis]|uniref:Transcription initiation protein n=1 Tax=Spirilliplanes yamanashiensis TaxID=42233 RepID=A0A8J3Y7J7_9ACTN|nr:YciI family protein [Spirilliplanes yamanashiensis]MDP9816982.1 hypothetical protein [Spirilliplanes yamanashiensis]GIJ03361.1 transcription initiation protein [Spirilliplanes yamanashiensis]